MMTRNIKPTENNKQMLFLYIKQHKYVIFAQTLIRKSCILSERKKTHPKFYFFDCGVVRAIQNRLIDPPTSHEYGFLFETYFFHELQSLSQYNQKYFEFSYWKNRNHEIDFIVGRGGRIFCGIECKTSRADISGGTIDFFQRTFPGIPLYIATADALPARRVKNGVDILPWRDVLNIVKEL